MTSSSLFKYKLAVGISLLFHVSAIIGLLFTDYNDFFIDKPTYINDKIANMSCRKMKHILQNEIPYCNDNHEDTFIKYTVKNINKLTQRGYVINMEILWMSYGLFKM